MRLAVSLACAGILIVSAAVVRAQRGEPARSGVISGVVQDDAGQPVANARVTAVASAMRIARGAVTDTQGSYEIAGLSSGSYTVTATAPGHWPSRFGQTSTIGPGTPVTIADGDRRIADITIGRLGAVSGRVVDEHGLPAMTPVVASQYVERNGIRALRPFNTVTSDRYGRYRIDGLPAGEYFVGAFAAPEDLVQMTPGLVQRALAAVAGPGSPRPALDEPPATVSFVPSFYPGVASAKAAVPVPIQPGVERTGIDLRLLVVPTAIVRGIVLTAEGQPVPNTVVALVNVDDTAPTGLAGATGPDGRFVIGTVPHGNYALVARTSSVGVVATGTFVDDVRLLLPPEGVISGRAAIDARGASLPEGSRLPPVRVMFRPVGLPLPAGVPAPGLAITFDASLEFRKAIPTGIYQAEVATFGATTPWTIESVMHDGQDLLDTPLTVRPGESVSDLVVTYVGRAASLSGTLTRPDGSAETGLLMLAFAADAALWTDGSRRVRSARPDASGRYEFAGLPPGDYLLAAVTDFDTSDGIGRDVLEPLAGLATPVSIAPGQAATMDFRIGRR